MILPEHLKKFTDNHPELGLDGEALVAKAREMAEPGTGGMAVAQVADNLLGPHAKLFWEEFNGPDYMRISLTHMARVKARQTSFPVENGTIEALRRGETVFLRGCPLPGQQPGDILNLVHDGNYAEVWIDAMTTTGEMRGKDQPVVEMQVHIVE
jgi:hypothetical protein